jgi:hypothetical protein
VKPEAIKGQSGKPGKDAGKVSANTWGDLPPGCVSKKLLAVTLAEKSG